MVDDRRVADSVGFGPIAAMQVTNDSFADFPAVARCMNNCNSQPSADLESFIPFRLSQLTSNQSRLVRCY